jgi:hypothetical protein
LFAALAQLHSRCERALTSVSVDVRLITAWLWAQGQIFPTRHSEASLMSDERTEEFSEPQVTINLSVAEGSRKGDAARNDAAADDARRNEATPNDATRGEATPARIESQRNQATPNDSSRGEATATRHETARDKEHAAAASQVSMANVRMQKRLPALDDDGDVGVQKEHIVTRDGKADLRFTGVLLASAAPASAPKGHWQEYRIYQTNGDKHVFSNVARTVIEGEHDTYEAEVFDPSPASVPSQLIRSAREIARARPLTWMDAAVAFFGYEPLAKALYRKLSVGFEEQIS